MSYIVLNYKVYFITLPKLLQKSYTKQLTLKVCTETLCFAKLAKCYTVLFSYTKIHPMQYIVLQFYKVFTFHMFDNAFFKKNSSAKHISFQPLLAGLPHFFSHNNEKENTIRIKLDDRHLVSGLENPSTWHLGVEGLDKRENTTITLKNTKKL